MLWNYIVNLEKWAVLCAFFFFLVHLNVNPAAEEMLFDCNVIVYLQIFQVFLQPLVTPMERNVSLVMIRAAQK